jgi:simple sugar transport system permease protein
MGTLSLEREGAPCVTKVRGGVPLFDAIAAVLRSTLDYAPSLVLTAVGAALSERSGVVNLALEGMMRTGAFTAAVVAFQTGSPTLGLLAGGFAGLLLALVHAWLCIRWRSDQVVVGIALNLVALAGITFVVEALFGNGATPAVERLPSLLGHPITTWIAIAVPFAVQGLLFRSVWGLRLRAVGEQPHAVASLGLSVARLRYVAVLGSGFLSGLGGATLSLAVLDHFNDLMPYGQGFIALAAMVFGKWSPLGAAAAATFFAFADAIRLELGSSIAVPRGVMLALPYLLSLLLLAGFVGRARPPAADGQPFDPESR